MKASWEGEGETNEKLDRKFKWPQVLFTHQKTERGVHIEFGLCGEDGATGMDGLVLTASLMTKKKKQSTIFFSTDNHNTNSQPAGKRVDGELHTTFSTMLGS